MSVIKSKNSTVVGAVVMVVALAVATAAMSADKKKFAADKGPATVDVSKYPASIQAKYKVFATRCSTCHTRARALNTDMTNAGWKRYVKRMMNKPDSGISPKSGKAIYGFLKYYQRVKDKRKAARKK